jgi:hypothetical protein
MDLEVSLSERQLSVGVQSVQNCADSGGGGSCWLCETREAGARAMRVNPRACSRLLEGGSTGSARVDSRDWVNS